MVVVVVMLLYSIRPGRCMVRSFRTKPDAVANGLFWNTSTHHNGSAINKIEKIYRRQYAKFNSSLFVIVASSSVYGSVTEPIQLATYTFWQYIHILLSTHKHIVLCMDVGCLSVLVLPLYVYLNDRILRMGGEWRQHFI